MDLDRIRSETPRLRRGGAFQQCRCAASPAVAVDTVVQYLQREARVGGYELADQHEEQLAGVYRSVAGVISASEDEIALVDSATRGWDMAFYSLQFDPGDPDTYHLHRVRRQLHCIPAGGGTHRRSHRGDPDTTAGDLDVDALAAMIDERTKLISINHVPTNTGLVNPAVRGGAGGPRRRRHLPA